MQLFGCELDRLVGMVFDLFGFSYAYADRAVPPLGRDDRCRERMHVAWDLALSVTNRRKLQRLRI